ncbi:hypothetical protein [Pedobacter nutrimenti]|uniref:Ig-like domain-containing protein n=1 Tax=Pedobacter nutrimenti TaxID=1241337 RepID=A0A318UYM9_9SPHI|nr:hypothetical protein [Pedobacter nutrimenti]PYF76709.1 hypothetical protein B0O44_101180 [Pedobacter nutrimenti]
MKTITTKIFIVAMVLLFGNAFRSTAQVLPTTSGVNFLCNGSDLDFGAPAANTTWIVRYSATSTTTPSAGVALTGNKVPAASVQTGYYYLISKGTAAGSCESSPQEIPVYKFAPISVAFTAADYCSENAATTTFTGTTTASDPNVSTYAYQWYTVDAGGLATAISGATSSTYTPTLTNNTNADISTTYRLQSGYLVAGNKYCGTTVDHVVKVLAKPTTPTITIPSTAQTW